MSTGNSTLLLANSTNLANTTSDEPGLQFIVENPETAFGRGINLFAEETVKTLVEIMFLVVIASIIFWIYICGENRRKREKINQVRAETIAKIKADTAALNDDIVRMEEENISLRTKIDTPQSKPKRNIFQFVKGRR